jgi:hypothetical protein
MPIIATNSGGGGFTPIEAGNYPARCYQMIHIGTIEENIQGNIKKLNKVRLTWELPTEMKEWKEGEGEKPAIISKDFTLSMNEKATLRKYLASWRGKDFTEEEAKAFDVTKLLGKACLLNVIHKPSKDGSKTFAEIGSISPLPKGMTCADQINPTGVLSYDSFDYSLFESLPDFIKDKVKSSDEYKAMAHPNATQAVTTTDEDDELPF